MHRKHGRLKVNCANCEYIANESVSLNNHKSVKHEGKPCNSLWFIYKHLSRKHVRFKFDCSKCEFQNDKKKNLKKHIEVFVWDNSFTTSCIYVTSSMELSILIQLGVCQCPKSTIRSQKGREPPGNENLCFSAAASFTFSHPGCFPPGPGPGSRCLKHKNAYQPTK